jgi:short-subunit dehydrogenase
LEGFGKVLKQELLPLDIHVAHINPAFMRTPLIDKCVDCAVKSFDEAPDNIRSNYANNVVVDGSKAILAMQEVSQEI